MGCPGVPQIAKALVWGRKQKDLPLLLPEPGAFSVFSRCRWGAHTTRVTLVSSCVVTRELDICLSVFSQKCENLQDLSSNHRIKDL